MSYLPCVILVIYLFIFFLLFSLTDKLDQPTLVNIVNKFCTKLPIWCSGYNDVKLVHN